MCEKMGETRHAHKILDHLENHFNVQLHEKGEGKYNQPNELI